MSIKVNNVTKLYGSQKALDGVSFEVKKGEVVGFLGPNGAGKSTMMKIISCFLPQTSGNVSVCGFDVEEQSLSVRKNVGYLPENNPLYSDMYVKEFLRFTARLYKVKNVNERVDVMIETTGLQVEQKKKIGALSKGYRQRVGLAQALIHDPQVLIFDEPTSGLDPNQLTEIRRLIKQIGKERTVMLSTHIMQEVDAICDRVIIINKGKIVADDRVDLIRKEDKNIQHVIVEFDKTVAKEKLMTVSGITNLEQLKNNSWKVEATGAKDIRPGISQFAQQNGLLVLGLKREEQSLEDVFKQLTAV